MTEDELRDALEVIIKEAISNGVPHGHIVAEIEKQQRLLGFNPRFGEFLDSLHKG